MNILFLTKCIPCSSPRSDEFRPYRFIRQLAAKNSIFLISFFSSRRELEHLDKIKRYCKRIELIPRKKGIRQFFSAILKSPITPFRVMNWYSKEFEDMLFRMLREENIDIVHVFSLHMTAYLGCIKQFPVVIDFVDSKSLFLRRYLECKFDILWPLRIIEMYQVYNYERRVAKKYPCLFTSDIDATSVCSRDNYIKYFIVPPILEDIYFDQAKHKNIEKVSNSLIFTGNMSYLPNIDAVVFFYKKILGIIKKHIPDVKLFIVGVHPPQKILKIGSNKNFTVTGYVEDIRYYLAQSVVYISPLRFGSGVKNKILEAMAMGVPVVATSVSNEGIWAQPNEEILIADNPKKFAAQAIKLLKDQKLRDRLAKKSKEFVKKFDFPNIINRLQIVYLDTIKEWRNNVPRK